MVAPPLTADDVAPPAPDVVSTSTTRAANAAFSQAVLHNAMVVAAYASELLVDHEPAD